MGDALLQKTYTIDFLSKKRIKNNGALPQYYVEDDHEPIISRETFMLVQEEIARRSSKRDKNGKKIGYSSNHCFSKIIYCAECGEIFRRVHWNNRGKKSIVWRCTSRLDKKSECHARTLNEELLKSAFLEAIHILQENKNDYLEILKKNIETVLKSGKNVNSESIDERLEKLQSELIEKTKKHEDYTQTAEETLELKAKKEQFTMDDSSKKDYIRRIKDLQNFIKNSLSECRILTKNW